VAASAGAGPSTGNRWDGYEPCEQGDDTHNRQESRRHITDLLFCRQIQPRVVRNSAMKRGSSISSATRALIGRGPVAETDPIQSSPEVGRRSTRLPGHRTCIGVRVRIAGSSA